jgi:transcriptional regulator with XRE-family HTH domain
MPATTPCDKLIATLRQRLKAQGHHYRDVAVRLGVSEGTVKRYLSGKAVTIDTLQQLAEIVGLDLLSLASLAQQDSTPLPELTKAQQAVLGKNPLLRLTYFLLFAGWSVAQIAREFELPLPRVEAALVRLQTLGVIRRISTHGIRMLARPNYQKRREGEFAGLNMNSGAQFLRAVDLRDPDCEWASSAARLSPASVTRLRTMIRGFYKEFMALGSSDLELPPDQVQWYQLFVGAQPVDRKLLFRLG